MNRQNPTKTFLIVLITLILLSATASAAHTYDTSAVYKSGTTAWSTTNPATISYTASSGATLMLLDIEVAGSTYRTNGTPTFNSKPFTFVGRTKASSSPEGSVEMWYLLLSTSDTGSDYTVSVPNTPTSRALNFHVSTYKSSTGLSALDTSAIKSATAKNPSQSLTTSANGDVIVSALFSGLQTPATVTSPGNQLFSNDPRNYFSALQYYLQPSAGNQSLGWTSSTSDDYGIITAAFKEVPLPYNGPMDTFTGSFGYTENYTDAHIFSATNEDDLIQLHDPTYTKKSTSLIYYGWLNVSVIQNYSDYDYIVIADRNAAEIDSRIGRPNNTYIYIAAGDYADTDAWLNNEKTESDWSSDRGYNTFIDEIDFGQGQTNFSTRLQALVSHIQSRGRKVMLNSYTTYNTFGTQGDSILKESAFSTWSGDVYNPTYSWENLAIEEARASYFAANSVHVMLMSFGPLNDYDKMFYDYIAGAVIYGYDGYNSFRYGQPDFQFGQREYVQKPLGTMTESNFTKTSATDWNRNYSKGRVHINPVAHTAWTDDGKIVNNLSFDIYLYSSAVPTGNGDLIVTFNKVNGTAYTLPYSNPTLYTWNWYNVPISSSEYREHGQYDIFYATRPTSGGYDFVGISGTPNSGRYSFFDTTTSNIPTGTYSSCYWNILPLDRNWMTNINVNYSVIPEQ
jgi:hypothetical protein